MSNDTQQLPPWLQDTYRVIVTAFPQGVPDEAYWPLLVLFGQNMSLRGLAAVMAHGTGREYSQVYNDVLRSQSPFEAMTFDKMVLDRVKRALSSAGYEEWRNGE